MLKIIKKTFFIFRKNIFLLFIYASFIINVLLLYFLVILPIGKEAEVPLIQERNSYFILK
jgi:hypothetical protein